MKKIPDEIDNPIDNVLIKIADRLCPYFYSYNHTPNMITTYSLITGLISCYFLYNKKLILFGIFYFISYFFDCLDGHYARKYDMTSDLGDMYDHIKDYLILIFIFYISYLNSKHNMDRYSISLLVIMLALMTIHMSCQELNCHDKFKGVHNSFLLTSNYLFSEKENIKWTRFFGCGTFTIFSILLISWINRN
jgi:phosphatidylglycerophosphate synthase